MRPSMSGSRRPRCTRRRDAVCRSRRTAPGSRRKEEVAGDAEHLRPHGPVEEGVDAQKAHRFSIFKAEAAVYHGREAHDRRIVDQAGQRRFRNRPRYALQGMGRPAVQKINRPGKAEEGRTGGKKHADHRGDAAPDAEDLKEAQAPSPRKVSQKGFCDDLQRKALSPAFSSRSAPSTMRKTRSEYFAVKGLWLAMTRVVVDCRHCR